MREPIHVLDWDKDDEGSFLYVGPDPTHRTIGVFKYNIATGAEHLMGASTGAASFSSGSDTVTLGDRDLTFTRAIERPEKPVRRASRDRASRPDSDRCEVAGLRHVAGNARAEHDGVFEGRE